MTPPVLTTARLVLRAPEESDLPDSVAMWADTDVVRFIGGRIRGPQEVWFALLRARGLWVLKGFGYWTVRDRETDAYLGEAGFADFRRSLPAELTPLPECGWAFARAAWGRGIATETLVALHGWLDATRPGATHCIINPENVASSRAAAKVGYRHTGDTLLDGSPIGIYCRRP